MTASRNQGNNDRPNTYTDSEVVHASNSPKFTQLQEAAVNPFFRAGHLFESDSASIFKHLRRLLRHHVGSQVYEHAYELIYEAGTSDGQAFIHDMASIFQSLRPFIKKWGGEVEGYDELHAEAMEEMQRSDFRAIWRMLTAWAIVPDIE